MLCRLALLTGLAGLGGCTGGNYQAPLAEYSEAMDRSGPVIVEASDDSPTRYGATVAGRTPVSTASAATDGARARVHRVRDGESLYAIAYQYDLDIRSLALANGINPPYTIYTGQELTLELNGRQPASVGAGESTTPGIGRVVTNNSVARAQPAGATTGGVMRQPIVRSTPSAEPVWQWPLRGQVLTDFQADTSASKGIDISGVNGQAIYAAADGDVVYAGNGIQGSGNLIIIRHSERLLSAYAHNRDLLVSEGQRIEAGQQIGEVGSNAAGIPLLHFEIRLDGKPVDPLIYLPRTN